MKPFLTGRNHVTATKLKVADGPGIADVLTAAAAHAHPGSLLPAMPSVETVREGEKVTRIIVTCTCGERIEIDCLYPGGG